MERKYYEAYDDRYRQVHREALQWFADSRSEIVMDTIVKYGIQHSDKILEVGCGEGRDAAYLLERGYDLLATDISVEAVGFCKKKWPKYAARFQTLNCLEDTLEERFEFLYAVAVVHMLVKQEDRDRFYRFLREHLTESGIGLVCSMGDGSVERYSDSTKAFELQERIHEPSGRRLQIAGTSYRAVSFGTFEEEIMSSGLEILEQGITIVAPDYGKMMYAVVKKSGSK